MLIAKVMVRLAMVRDWWPRGRRCSCFGRLRYLVVTTRSLAEFFGRGIWVGVHMVLGLNIGPFFGFRIGAS